MDKPVIQYVPITKLLLDAGNPRLGHGINSSDLQKDVLENIIKNHGISDLLVSISANGYFSAEPLVCVRSNDDYIVVEGNRRLATCLVLLKDKRAADYHHLAVPHLGKHDVKELSDLPISVFEDRSQLTSYLGVRHIQGPQAWDSYAKAQWLFQYISSPDVQMTVRQACEMIGDSSTNTVRKILEGYVLINELRSRGQFAPEDSQVKGRGSNLDYPFSWVYTALGYQSIRQWVELTPIGADDVLDPEISILETDRGFDNAGKLITFLFGSKLRGRSPVIRESRGIANLSKIISDRKLVKMLETGSNVDDVVEFNRSADDRLFDIMFTVEENLKNAATILAGTSEIEKPGELLDFCETSINYLKNIELTIRSRTLSDSDEP